MRIYENIEAERDRIQACIQKYGWTSDHNLDWFIDAIADKKGKPVFIEFQDGGLLVHKYLDKYRIWSDPLSKKDTAASKILEFSLNVLNDNVKDVWCDDVSGHIRNELIKTGDLSIGEVDYSLDWPVPYHRVCESHC